MSSSFYDPGTELTLSLPGIELSDADKDGCGLVRKAQLTSGRKLTENELASSIGDIKHTPTWPTR
jgi:hypothetical protein